jgi:crossover junction endodeoxyribonuclease RuvC
VANREVDHGRLETSPTCRYSERLLAVHALLDEPIELHELAVVAVERLFFRATPRRRSRSVRPGRVLLAAAHTPAGPRSHAERSESAVAGYGAADKEQVQRMVQIVLGMAEPPRPDDAADALAIAVWAANSETSQPGRLSPVMDRAAVAPITRGSSGYERAVHEALARERSEARAAKRRAG